jgi:hypothetical protein
MRAAQPSLGISLQGGDGHLTTQIDPPLDLQPGDPVGKHAPPAAARAPLTGTPPRRREVP